MLSIPIHPDEDTYRRPDHLEQQRRAMIKRVRLQEEWPEERIQALVARYEETDQLALQEALNQKQEWD